MSSPTLLDPQQLVNLSVTLTAGQTMFAAVGTAQTPVFDVRGMGALVGSITLTTAPAAGFPRIRESRDGTNFDIVTPLTRDASQANFNYPIAQILSLPFATIEVTDGGAGSTCRAYVEAVPLNDAAVAAGGGGGGGTTPSTLTPLGYEQLTVAAVAIALASVPSGAVYALLECETADIRYRDDGVNPTAAVGMPLLTNQSLFYLGGATGLAALRFIRQGAVSAVLNVLYYQ